MSESQAYVENFYHEDHLLDITLDTNDSAAVTGGALVLQAEADTALDIDGAYVNIPDMKDSSSVFEVVHNTDLSRPITGHVFTVVLFMDSDMQGLNQTITLYPDSTITVEREHIHLPTVKSVYFEVESVQPSSPVDWTIESFQILSDSDIVLDFEDSAGVNMLNDAYQVSTISATPVVFELGSIYLNTTLYPQLHTITTFTNMTDAKLVLVTSGGNTEVTLEQETKVTDISGITDLITSIQLKVTSDGSNRVITLDAVAFSPMERPIDERLEVEIQYNTDFGYTNLVMDDQLLSWSLGQIVLQNSTHTLTRAETTILDWTQSYIAIQQQSVEAPDVVLESVFWFDGTVDVSTNRDMAILFYLNGELTKYSDSFGVVSPTMDDTIRNPSFAAMYDSGLGFGITGLSDERILTSFSTSSMFLEPHINNSIMLIPILQERFELISGVEVDPNFIVSVHDLDQSGLLDGWTGVLESQNIAFWEGAFNEEYAVRDDFDSLGSWIIDEAQSTADIYSKTSRYCLDGNMNVTVSAADDLVVETIVLQLNYLSIDPETYPFMRVAYNGTGDLTIEVVLIISDGGAPYPFSILTDTPTEYTENLLNIYWLLEDSGYSTYDIAGAELWISEEATTYDTIANKSVCLDSFHIYKIANWDVVYDNLTMSTASVAESDGMVLTIKTDPDKQLVLRHTFIHAVTVTQNRIFQWRERVGYSSQSNIHVENEAQSSSFSFDIDNTNWAVVTEDIESLGDVKFFELTVSGVGVEGEGHFDWMRIVEPFTSAFAWDDYADGSWDPWGGVLEGMSMSVPNPIGGTTAIDQAYTGNAGSYSIEKWSSYSGNPGAYTNTGGSTGTDMMVHGGEVATYLDFSSASWTLTDTHSSSYTPIYSGYSGTYYSEYGYKTQPYYAAGFYVPSSDATHARLQVLVQKQFTIYSTASNNLYWELRQGSPTGTRLAFGNAKMTMESWQWLTISYNYSPSTQYYIVVTGHQYTERVDPPESANVNSTPDADIIRRTRVGIKYDTADNNNGDIWRYTTSWGYYSGRESCVEILPPTPSPDVYTLSSSASAQTFDEFMDTHDVRVYYRTSPSGTIYNNDLDDDGGSKIVTLPNAVEMWLGATSAINTIDISNYKTYYRTHSTVDAEFSADPDGVTAWTVPHDFQVNGYTDQASVNDGKIVFTVPSHWTGYSSYSASAGSCNVDDSSFPTITVTNMYYASIYDFFFEADSSGLTIVPRHTNSAGVTITDAPDDVPTYGYHRSYQQSGARPGQFSVYEYTWNGGSPQLKNSYTPGSGISTYTTPNPPQQLDSGYTVDDMVYYRVCFISDDGEYAWCDYEGFYIRSPRVDTEHPSDAGGDGEDEHVEVTLDFMFGSEVLEMYYYIDGAGPYGPVSHTGTVNHGNQAEDWNALFRFEDFLGVADEEKDIDYYFKSSAWNNGVERQFNDASWTFELGDSDSDAPFIDTFNVGGGVLWDDSPYIRDVGLDVLRVRCDITDTDSGLGSITLYYSYNGGAYNPTPMDLLGDDQYYGDIPLVWSNLEFADTMAFYVIAYDTDVSSPMSTTSTTITGVEVWDDDWQYGPVASGIDTTSIIAPYSDISDSGTASDAAIDGSDSGIATSLCSALWYFVDTPGTTYPITSFNIWLDSGTDYDWDFTIPCVWTEADEGREIAIDIYLVDDDDDRGVVDRKTQHTTRLRDIDDDDIDAPIIQETAFSDSMDDSVSQPYRIQARITDVGDGVGTVKFMYKYGSGGTYTPWLDDGDGVQNDGTWWWYDIPYSEWSQVIADDTTGLRIYFSVYAEDADNVNAASPLLTDQVDDVAANVVKDNDGAAPFINPSNIYPVEDSIVVD